MTYKINKISDLPAEYSKPDVRRSMMQCLTDVVIWTGYFTSLTFVSLYYSEASFFMPLIYGIGIFGGLKMSSTFILQHDCGHQSLFKEKKWNNFWGKIFAFVTVFPYTWWAIDHDSHHRDMGKNTGRNAGEIPTPEKDEKNHQNFLYRLLRTPLLPFVGTFYFIESHWFPRNFNFKRGFSKRGKSQVINLSTSLALFVALYWVSPHALYAHLVCLVIWHAIAFHTFYLQHNHEGMHFDGPERKIPYFEKCLKGSSFLDYSKFWWKYFYRSINFHHIHHLKARIPNYKLKEVHDKYFIIDGQLDDRVVRLKGFKQIMDTYRFKEYDSIEGVWIKKGLFDF